MIRRSDLEQEIFLAIIVGLFSGFVATNLWASGIVIVLMLCVWCAILLKSNHLPYILLSLLTPFALLLLPPGKHVIRIGPISLAYIPFVFYGMISLISWLIRGSPSIRLNSGSKWVDISLYGWLLYGTISILWVTDVLSWATYTAQWWFYVILVFGVTISNVRGNKASLITLLKAIACSIGVMSLAGIIRLFLLGYSDSNVMLILNRNASILLPLPFLPMLFSLYDVFKSKIIFGLLLVVSFLSLIFTFSRAAFLGTMMGSLSYLVLSMNRSNLRKVLRYVPVIVLVFFILMYTVVVFVPEHYMVKLTTRLVSIRNAFIFLEGQSPIASDMRRANLVRAGYQIFKENPLLGTGVGMENYLYYFPYYIDVGKQARTHNLYLSYLGELGLLGFPWLISFLGFSATFLFRSIDRMPSVTHRRISVGFFSGHLALLVTFFFNEYLTFPAVWFFWGIAFGYNIAFREPR